MKTHKILLPLIIVLLTFHAGAADEDLPYDIAALQSKRDTKVIEIDRAYVRELEKLKIKYTKLGELETANKIVAMITEIHAANPAMIRKVNEAVEKLIGSWVRANHGLSYDIKPDGTATHGKESGRWSVENNVLEIKWQNGYGALIKLGQKGRSITMTGYSPGRGSTNDYKITKKK